MMNKKTINDCKRFLQENKPLYLELNLPIYGIIYKVENIKNGNVYIGQTKRSFNERYSGGLKGWIKDKKIDDSISDFKVTEILDVAFCRYQLDLLEMYYINKYDSFYDGYNKKLNYPSYKHLLECCDILNGTGYIIKNTELINGVLPDNIYNIVKDYHNYCFNYERNMFIYYAEELYYYEYILDEYFIDDYDLRFTDDFGLYLRRYLTGKIGLKWGLIINDKNIKDFIPKKLYKEFKKHSSRKYLKKGLIGYHAEYRDNQRDTLLSVNENELIYIYIKLYLNTININKLGEYNPILTNCGFKNLLSNDKRTFNEVFRELEKRFKKYRIRLYYLNIHLKLLLEVCDYSIDNNKDNNLKELFLEVYEEIVNEFKHCLKHQNNIELYDKFFNYNPLFKVNEDVYSIIQKADRNKYPLLHEYIFLKESV